MQSVMSLLKLLNWQGWGWLAMWGVGLKNLIQSSANNSCPHVPPLPFHS